MQPSSAEIALTRIRNEQIPAPKKAPVLSFPNFREKAQNHVFSEKNAKNEQGRGKDGSRTG